MLAALGPRMLALAAERAGGAHTYLVPVEHTDLARASMGSGALLAPSLMVVLEPNRTTALEVARKGLAVYLRAPNYANNLRRLGFSDEDLAAGGSDRLVDAIVAVGGVAEVIRRIREHLDAGADHVCVQPLTGGAWPAEEWRELAHAMSSV